MATAAAHAPSDDVAAASGPWRRCIVTRRSRPAGELLRFVVDPDGGLVFDADGKLPGRGLWVGADRATLARAVKRSAFAKAARQRVAVPADLVERVDAALAAKAVERLALCRRAGLLVAGTAQVHATVKAGEAALLLAAAEAGGSTADRLGRLAAGVAPALPACTALAAAELGRPLSRAAAYYVALKRGGATTAFMAQAWRLAQLRAPDGDGWREAAALARPRAGHAPAESDETGSDAE